MAVWKDGEAFANGKNKNLIPVHTSKFVHIQAGNSQLLNPQLTQKYMTESFNPRTPDSPDVRYFSYGAQLNPHLTSVFRTSGGIVKAAEGPNDGLVSVKSSQWGKYQGTLDNVSHLDLINWTNRLRVGFQQTPWRYVLTVPQYGFLFLRMFDRQASL